MKYLKIITTTILLITFATLSSQAQAVQFKYDAAGNMIKRLADIVCYANLTINANVNNGEKLDRLYTSSETIKTQNITQLNGADVVAR